MSRNKEKEHYVSPDVLNLEYYQISLEIFSKFPRHRPPLTLHLFKEEVRSLVPVAIQGQFLNKERQEEIENHCRQGNLFVSRADQAIYAQHISEQLDLVLLDKNLKESEIIEIFRCSLPKRLSEFFDQPGPLNFERLQADILVLTEYLWQDPSRIRGLFHHLFTEDGLTLHEYNVAVTGLALYIMATGGQPNRRALDRLALGLFAHDLGMSKIPSFILKKSLPLTGEDHEKIVRHPLVGAALLRKLGEARDEVLQCLLEHHERIDGSGYPQKMSGMDIGLPGRICAVADSFSAMASQRPYAGPMPQEEACVSLARDQRYDKRVTAMLSSLVTGK